MKIRDLTLLLATLIGTVAAASMIVTVVVLLDNRELRQEMRELRRGWDEVARENRELKQERSETESAFATQEERLKNLEAELAAVRAGIRTNVSSTPQAARAYRAPVFLGQQYLGQGWVAPRQTATDPSTGQVRYEPVVLLDPSARAGIPAGKTNVIEREVVTPTTVNYNYPYPYYYYWWWPSFWTVATNADGCDRPEQPPDSPPQAPQASPDVRFTVATMPRLPDNRPFAAPISRATGMAVGRPAPTLSPGRSQTVSGRRPLSAQPKSLPLSSPLN